MGTNVGAAAAYAIMQQQRDYRRAADRARLMAGQTNSSAYDPGED